MSSSQQGKKLTRGQLIQSMKELAEEIGETPTARQMKYEGPHALASYYKYFENWRDAVESAGLNVSSRSKMGGSGSVSVMTNSDGHREIKYRYDGNYSSAMVHRLHATLLVDDIDDLQGKIVHHANGCPFDNRLENYEIVGVSEHREKHRLAFAGEGYNVLCRQCGVPTYVSDEEIDYCPQCAGELDREEIDESEYIDWKEPGETNE